MGLFSRLKRKEKIRLTVDEVPGFLDRHIKSLDKEGKVSLFLQDISNKKNIITKKLDYLKEHHPQAEDYAEVIEKGLEQLDIPQKHADLAKQAQFLSEQVSEIIEQSQEHYFALKEGLSKQVIPIEHKLHDLENSCAELAAHFEKLGLENYRKVREKYENYVLSKDKTAKMKQQLLIEEEKKKEPKEQLQKIKMRKNKIENTRSYHIFDEIWQKREELFEQRRELLSDYEATIDQLKASLEQFKEVDKRDQVIHDYITDPVKALVRDKSLVFFDILKDMKKNLSKELKEEAKTLTKKYLKEQQDKVGELQLEIENLTTRLNKDSIGMMLREQKGYEQTIKDVLHEIDKSIEMIENELERTSVQLAWQQLRDELHKMGDHIILQEENKETIIEHEED